MKCALVVQRIPLGTPIPGPVTDQLVAVAQAQQLYVSVGLFEREGDTLYDTAILIDRKGEIVLKYRRVSKGWHHPKANPDVYKEGWEVGSYDSEFGRICFLICGDICDEPLKEQVRAQRPDIVLFPYARCFDDGSHDQSRWEREEMPGYIAGLQSVGTVALMVNYLDPEYFGGAFVISRSGEVLGRFHLGQEGILHVDLETPELLDG
jgi:N-carbamoylputrescine amidase